MLGKLEGNEKEDWTRHLDELVFAYNCTRSGITGFSPYFLMFGRRPRLPVDYIFPTIPLNPKHKPRSQYVAELQAVLKQAFAKAEAASVQEAARQKRHFDKRTNAAVLAPGDLVLVRTLNYKGKRKLVDRWEEKPSRVVSQLGDDSPIYEICDAEKPELKRHYHRNHLYLLEMKEGTEMVPNSTELDEPPVSTGSQTDEGDALPTSASEKPKVESSGPPTPAAPTDKSYPKEADTLPDERDEGSSVDPPSFHSGNEGVK
jgi:hypothetical protein